jgi:hypothetical protein
MTKLATISQSDKVSQSKSLKPPSDLPYPRSEAQESQARQSPSRPSRRGDYYKRADDEEAYGLRQRGRSSSASKQVALEKKEKSTTISWRNKGRRDFLLLSHFCRTLDFFISTCK